MQVKAPYHALDIKAVVACQSVDGSPAGHHESRYALVHQFVVVKQFYGLNTMLTWISARQAIAITLRSYIHRGTVKWAIGSRHNKTGNDPVPNLASRCKHRRKVTKACGRWPPGRDKYILGGKACACPGISSLAILCFWNVTESHEALDINVDASGFVVFIGVGFPCYDESRFGECRPPVKCRFLYTHVAVVAIVVRPKFRC